MGATCCPPPPSAWRWANLSIFGLRGMAVHARSDVVSSVLRRGHMWEPELTQTLRRELTRAHTRSISTSTMPTAGAPLHLLDIGANIGWFTLVAAAHGADVTAIEPSVLNAWLVRKSLAANPHLAPRVTLHNVGAGATTGGSCDLISPDSNVGDTMLECGDVAAGLARWNAWGATQRAKYRYRSRGTLRLARIDELVTRPVDVLKIDIEGYEPLAAQGWEQLFARRRPRLIVSEVQLQVMRDNGFSPSQYLMAFARMGYTLHVGTSAPALRSEAAVMRWLNRTEWRRSYDVVMTLRHGPRDLEADLGRLHTVVM